MPEKIKHIKDSLNNKLEKYKIKQGLGYINNSTQELCSKMKISVEWTAKNLYKAGVSANVASLIGFAIGCEERELCHAEFKIDIAFFGDGKRDVEFLV